VAHRWGGHEVNLVIHGPSFSGKDKGPGSASAVQGPSARAGSSGATRLGGHHRHLARWSVDRRAGSVKRVSAPTAWQAAGACSHDWRPLAPVLSRD
jgi:hypothetical protein